ncbi:MAG: cysteine dioxygenase family protein [Crocinitomicaceae bacterium]
MEKLSLPISISNLIKSLECQNSFNPTEITNLLYSADISEEDLLMWAKFDHPVEDGYGRALVHAGDNFEVMVMSWNPRDQTAIHNHGYTTWGAVQVFGNLDHVSFNCKDNFLYTLHKEKLSAGEVIAVNQKLIHQMGNSSDEQVLSIHVYGRDEVSDNITADSFIYEVGKHEIQVVNGGVFYDLKNNEIARRSSGLKSDPLTEIAHYTSLLNFYFKSNARGPQFNKAVKYFQDRSFENRLNFEIELDSKGILYLVELKKARKILSLLKEPTKTLDAIIFEINDIEKYS